MFDPVAYVVYLYVYVMTFLSGLVFAAFIAIPAYFQIIMIVPYFGTPLFQSIPLVIAFHAALQAISNKLPASIALVILFILLLGLMILYGIYLVILFIFPETLFLQPFRIRFLKNPVFDTLISTGLFPLLDKIRNTLLSIIAPLDKLFNISKYIKDYTKNTVNDIKKQAMNVGALANNDSIKLLMTKGDNKEGLKELKKSFVPPTDYSKKDITTLTNTFMKCADDNWSKIDKKTKIKDKLAATAKNNTVKTLCDLKIMIASSNMKQQVTTTTPGKIKIK